MFAIDDLTAVAVMPAPEAAGTPGFFTEGNPALGQAATYVRASWLNGQMQEQLNVLTAAGITPSKTTYDQLLTALRSNALVSGVATGAANTYAVAFTPAIAALVDGMVLWFKASASNTGASTLNINAVGVKPIVGGAHAALQGGEIIANGKCMVVWNATLNSFVLLECTGAALQVGTPTQSQHAATLGQLAMGSRVKGLTGNTVGAGFTTATFSAAEVLMRNPTSGASVLALNVGPVVCNINTAGPIINGRDQVAAFSNNSWVHFWFITNGTTTGVIASASPTAPTLPSGYITQAYICAVRLGAGTLADVAFFGNRAIYSTAQNAFINGTAATPTSISVATLVPPNAETFNLQVQTLAVSSAAGGGYSATAYLGPTATNQTYLYGLGGVAVAGQIMSVAGQTFEMPNVGQQFYYYIGLAAGAGTSTGLNVNGYKNPNGGE